MIDKTEIAIILDKSGSMSSRREDTISGFNKFINEQKAVDKPADITIIQFDDVMEEMYSGNIKYCPELNTNNYVPRASTKLYETVCKTIDKVGEKLAAIPESNRPNKVLITIISDGEENSSAREFSLKLMNDKIVHQEAKYNWEITFIGFTADARRQSDATSIKGFSKMPDKWANSVTASFNQLSVGVSKYRAACSVDQYKTENADKNFFEE